MSPYCRGCLGIARPGELRCPLDQQFYLRRECSACQAELFPREMFCVHCGSPVRSPREVLLLPTEGRLGARLGSLVLDLFGVGLTTTLVAWMLPGLVVAVLGLVCAVGYRAWARASGRQSFGQSVFFLLTVGRDAAPASLSQAVKRTLAEFVALPMALVLGGKAMQDLDRFSDTFEVRLV